VAKDPEKTRAAKRAWRLANPDKVREQKRRSRAKDPEAARAKDRAYHAANRERILANAAARHDPEVAKAREAKRRQNPARQAYMAEYLPQWIENNRDARRDIAKRAVHRRRARLAGSNSPGVTREEWAAIVEYFGRCCAYCLRPADTIDHVEPIAMGGRDAPDNVVPACKRCNSSKGAKSLLFWLLTSQYARGVTARKPNT